MVQVNKIKQMVQVNKLKMVQVNKIKQSIARRTKIM